MTADSSPYFREACDRAPFGPEKMGTCDLVSTESLSSRVHALEPGQRYEPPVCEHSDKLHAVLRGRAAFVVGDSRRILGTGDVALAPAGVEHRGYANRGERLVLLVVTCRSAPQAVVETEPCVASAPASAERPPAPPVTKTARSLPGLTVPTMSKPAEAPPELPETSSAAPTVRGRFAAGKEVVQTSSSFNKVLESLRLPEEVSSDGAPPVLPEAKRCAPRPPPMKSGPRTDTSGLPEIFRMSTKRG